MNFVPPTHCEEFDQRTLAGGTAVAWISRELEDTCWDNFLQETPLGQFEQSTIWARAKQPEGWRPVRILVTVEDKVVAGFQILWQSSWRGRMGYVSKGPVVLPGYPGLAEYVTALLQALARKERMRALVVQPPDLCLQISGSLARRGFMLDVVAKVNDATWMVDLRDGFEAVQQQMSKQTRRKVKQAASRGLMIREGGRQDLEAFFGLMLSTCRRQAVAPNPPDVRYLLALWDAAHPAGCIRLFLAKYDSKPLAGLLCITFGQTFTLWKKGWTSTEDEFHPNYLTHHEALKWASQSGYRFADFSAFNKQMALAMLSGKALSSDQEHSRDVFNIRIGGMPRLLPEARIYFPNPLVRLAYLVMFCTKLRQAKRQVQETCGFAALGRLDRIPQ